MSTFKSSSSHESNSNVSRPSSNASLCRTPQPSITSSKHSAKSLSNLIQPTSKKYQKLSYEIDCQNFLIAKIQREIKLKSNRGFPAPCLESLKIQLCNEKKKLVTMIELAQCEQQIEEGEELKLLSVVDSDDSQQLKPPVTPSDISKISGFSDMSFAETLLTDNESLESDRFKLQEKLFEKEETLQYVEAKIAKLQCQLIKMCRDNQEMTGQLKQSQGTKTAAVPQYIKSKLDSYIDNTAKLSCNIKTLESHMCELRNELNCLKKEKTTAEECLSQSKSFVRIESKVDCRESSQTSDDQCAAMLRKLEALCLSLQMEVCQKDNQIKEMAKRLENVSVGCDDNEHVTTGTLKQHIAAQNQEIDCQKIFISELQNQLRMFQEKFIKAQEKVEYQRYVLESVDLKNTEVEAQINQEICRIKSKFQEKLTELCPYPQKYENAQLELEESKKAIKSLQSQLKVTSEALCNANCQLEELKQKPDNSISNKYEKLRNEFETMKKNFCGMKTTKEFLEEKLTMAKQELETLRRDSMKIIETTKVCAEKNRQILNQHANNLEINLAQCRASAALSLTEKEETIKKMKQELATLCSHFYDCQSQIEQLKNRVCFLTNQGHSIRLNVVNQYEPCYPEH